ncbi:MAG: hypothetical protein GWO16_14415, partial [Gammaproteobacteria bacterium]|nr:hypothetical protein [Gammaproteobacteria bacterium]NIR97484.1 hypothetical protein [Gammaproteobacteria bacterium]NIT64755.1 hypothetical protein [Gammaproteobacteria bacterium]NIY33335.1 hypothetical protein [Gammaproteobacteria bacterium]
AAHEEQLQPLRIQVEELYQALHAYAAGLESEPDRLETVNTRLAEVEKVTRRHGGDVEAALTRLAEAEQELAALEEVQDTLAAMDARVQALAGKLHSLCGKLSGRRK